MNWEDEGFVIGKRRFRENAIILDVFTGKFGKISGIVYGGTSRKVKNHLQLMNKIWEDRILQTDGFFGTTRVHSLPVCEPLLRESLLVFCKLHSGLYAKGLVENFSQPPAKLHPRVKPES